MIGALRCAKTDQNVSEMISKHNFEPKNGQKTTKLYFLEPKMIKLCSPKSKIKTSASLTQSDSIQPKSILIQPKSRSRAGNVDLVPDSANPCAICAAGDQQKSSGYLNSSHTIPNLSQTAQDPVRTR